MNLVLRIAISLTVYILFILAISIAYKKRKLSEKEWGSIRTSALFISFVTFLLLTGLNQ